MSTIKEKIPRAVIPQQVIAVEANNRMADTGDSAGSKEAPPEKSEAQKIHEHELAGTLHLYRPPGSAPPPVATPQGKHSPAEGKHSESKNIVSRETNPPAKLAETHKFKDGGTTKFKEEKRDKRNHEEERRDAGKKKN